MHLLNQKYQALGVQTPEYHFVLGSGFGNAFIDIAAAQALDSNWVERGQIPFKDLDYLHHATAPGHPGTFKVFENKTTRKSVIFQLGRLHGYEGIEPKEVTQTVTQSFLAGTRNFVLTNAAGSLNPAFKVGSVMVIRDHVNMTGKNPLVGPNPKDSSGRELGPRFPDLSQAYDKAWRTQLNQVLKGRQLDVNEGIYLGLLGPTYETPSEVKLFASWGMHAVGMSTVWETISLRHLGAKVGGISLMSNLACGLVTDEPLDHESVLKESRKSAQQIVLSLFDFASIQG